MTTTLKTLSALAIAAAALTVTSVATTSIASAAPLREWGHGPVVAHGSTFKSPIIQRGGLLNKGRIISCLACNLPRPRPFKPHPLPWRFHHGNYGWYHWHNWYHGPKVIVTGAPEAVPVAAPVQAAPVAATPVSAAPCSCLTKQSLPNGGVLFQDICTKESAIATPAKAAAR